MAVGEASAQPIALSLDAAIQRGLKAHLGVILRSAQTARESKAMLCCFAAGVIAVLFRELTYSSLLEHAATAMLFVMCLALLVIGEAA